MLACWIVHPALAISVLLSALGLPLLWTLATATIAGLVSGVSYALWRGDLFSPEPSRPQPPPPPPPRPPRPPTFQPAPRPQVPATRDTTAEAALAAADDRVRAESEAAGRTRDDRRYAEAIDLLNKVVAKHPAVPGGKLALHSHRAQYLTFQATRAAERMARAAPADQARMRHELHLMYVSTEAELRAALAAAAPGSVGWAREAGALAALLAAGADQGEPDRTGEAVSLLRRVLTDCTTLSADARRQAADDLADVEARTAAD